MRDSLRSIRFPIALEGTYHCEESHGSCQTVNMSSSGLLVTIDAPLAVGTQVTVLLPWPAVLEGRIALQVEFRCVVVRSEGNQVGLRTLHHEFRTLRHHPQRADASKLLLIRKESA